MGGKGAQGIQIALQPELQVTLDAALPEEQGQLREASAEITIVGGARQGRKQLIRRKGQQEKNTRSQKQQTNAPPLGNNR